MGVFGNPFIGSRHISIGENPLAWTPSTKLREINGRWNKGEFINGLDPTFGYETAGAHSHGLDNNIRGTAYPCPENGIAESLTMYLSGWASGEKVKGAIYKKSDASLIGVTEERSDGGAEGWHTFNFGTPKPPLFAQDYVLCGWSDSVVPFHYDIEAVIQRYFKNQPYDTFPDPFDGTADSTPEKRSIYCTYTAVAKKPASSIVPLMRGMDLIGMIKPKPFSKRFPKLTPLRV